MKEPIYQRQPVEHHRLARMAREGLPVGLRVGALQLAERGADEVLEAPPGDDRVVEGDEGGDEADKEPHPVVPGAGGGADGGGGSAAGTLAQRELGEQQRDRPQEKENHPRDQELPAAVLCRDPGEPPDVPGSDRHSDRGQEDAPAGAEPFGRVLHRCRLFPARVSQPGSYPAS